MVVVGTDRRSSGRGVATIVEGFREEAWAPRWADVPPSIVLRSSANIRSMPLPRSAIGPGNEGSVVALAPPL